MNRSGVSTAFHRSPGQIERLGGTDWVRGILPAGLLGDGGNDGVR